MRLTEFWERMALVLGEGYARSWAADHVMPQLGGRTVDEALRAGQDTKKVWRAVVANLDVPPHLR